MRLALIVALLIGIVVVLHAGDETVKVFVNGKLQSYDPAARTRGGVTYVPLRQGATSLGFSVEWMPSYNAAKVCDDKGCVLIRANEGIMVDGSLFLPLRKMGEAFGAKLSWDAGNKADPTSETYLKFQTRLAELTNRPGITDLTLWKPVDFRVQVTIQEL